MFQPIRVDHTDFLKWILKLFKFFFLLPRGSKRDVFQNLVTNLKQNGKNKKVLESSEMGILKECKGELRHSKSRMSVVKFDWSCN
jgi:hypothetical protein